MQNIDSEIVKSPKASAFTLIVAFVCVALVGLALIPLLPVKLNPSRTLPGFTVRFSMPGTSARVVEMTATSKLEAMLARVKGNMWMQRLPALKLLLLFVRRGRNYRMG